MSLRVLIVDDEPLALDRLRLALNAMDDVTVVGEAVDGHKALELARSTPADLILLDIQMPGQSGLDVARTLTSEQRPEVVFVTAFADFAADAFELEAVDYLLKPVREDRLAEAVRRARRRLASRQAGETPAPLSADAAPEADSTGYEQEFWIKRREGYQRVPVDHIRRIEAARDYALLHTATNTHILRITMSDLERRLDPAQLLRVHRSAFVRTDTVERIERTGQGVMQMHTVDGVVIDVGPSYAKRVAAALGLAETI